MQSLKTHVSSAQFSRKSPFKSPMNKSPNATRSPAAPHVAPPPLLLNHRPLTLIFKVDSYAPKLHKRIEHLSFALFVLLTCVLVPAPATIAGTTWDGGDVQSNWTYNNNWNPDGSPTPGSNVTLTFAGNVRLDSYNDYAGFNAWQSIIFASNAGSFNMTSASGANWDLYFKIENNSAAAQSISIDAIALDSSVNGNEFDPTAGNLTISAKDIYTNGHNLNVFGTKTLAINNAGGNGIQQGGKLVFGSGFSGTVVLNGSNTYTGGTTLNSGGGTLGIGNNNALGSGDITISGTSNISAVNGARIIGNGVSLSGASLSFTGSNSLTINGALTGANGSDRFIDNRVTAATLTLAGNVYITSNQANSQTLTFGATSGASANAGTTTLVSGVIANNSGTNTTASNIAAQGGGLTILSGNNTYTGTTTVTNGSTELRIGNGGATGTLGSGNVTVTSGTLSFNRNNILSVANNISGTGSVSQIGTGTTTLSGTGAYTGGTSVSNGALIINGNQSAATGAVSVTNSGTVLGGIGSIGGVTTINSGANITGATLGTVGTLTLSNNSSTGALVFSGSSSSSLATYSVDISGATSDKLAITGRLNLSNNFDNITFNGTPNGTSSYILATYASETGTFNFGTAPAGYQLIYGSTELDLVPVPEPSTWVTAFLSVGFLGWSQRKKVQSLKAKVKSRMA